MGYWFPNYIQQKLLQVRTVSYPDKKAQEKWTASPLLRKHSICNQLYPKIDTTKPYRNHKKQLLLSIEKQKAGYDQLYTKIYSSKYEYLEAYAKGINRCLN